jgi:hypothetical protein
MYTPWRKCTDVPNGEKKGTTFYMGFINTSEQDVTLLPTLEGLHAVTCCEQTVTYPLPPGHEPAAGSISQLTPDQEPSATRQTEIVTELCINQN